MGNNCTASRVHEQSCGVLPIRSGPFEEDGPDCGLCGDDGKPANLSGPHPLLIDGFSGDRTSPRTPRGPAPPWATMAEPLPAIDLTATGPTPPRSPTPPRATPPGLPEDEISPQDILSGSSLAASFDDKFIHDLFRAARSDNASTLGSMLHQVNGGAFALVATACGPERSSGPGGALAAERREKAAEMVASFLSHVRAAGTPSRETLLGAAAGGGHLEAVQLLLSTRADPAVADDQGNAALHRAAESGILLAVLMVLDRLQAASRAISVAELANADGETPEMLAALGGASEVCKGFEIFGDLQSDAELRQLGSSTASPDLAGSLRNGGTGDLLAFLDLAADSGSANGSAASALLRGVGVGNGMVHDLHRRVPEDPAHVFQLVERVCCGIRTAEDLLLNTKWNPSDPSLDPALRTFVCTAEVRSSWQRLRMQALEDEGSSGLEDFCWQTHLPAETMVTTLANARGDTFQLLLTVLWLYTREAWLRHIVDTLAGALAAAGSALANCSAGHVEGGTGAAGWRPEVPPSMSMLSPMVEALSPLMQLIQAALAWFEEAGIRHSGVTYRPLSLPMLGLQRLIDRYIAARRDGEGSDDDRREVALSSGAWVCLGAGAFFSTTSSRAEAVRRLARTRCNVLLMLRPDEHQACFPKQMSLRGTSVDDVLFPLGALFRITRITRTNSSDLDPEACRNVRDRDGGSRGPWPVMVFELAAASRTLDVFETLEQRNDLGVGELEVRLQEWINGAVQSERHERSLAAGELLTRCSAYGHAHDGRNVGQGGLGGSGDGGYIPALFGSRSERAITLMLHSIKDAESSSQTDASSHIARALLALARCRISAGLANADDLATDGKRAISLLTDGSGANHPETCAARTAWRELGVRC